MIRKWIEKKIDARVNEYLNRVSLMLDEEKIAEHVEVDLELVAEHIEASDLVDYIDLDDALDDALDYDRLASEVNSWELAQELDLEAVAQEVDKYDLAQSIDKDDIASALDPCPSDIAEHIDLEDLAGYVASEHALTNELVNHDDFVSNLTDNICEAVEERVSNAMVEQCQAATNINTDKIIALIEAMEAFELAITTMRWAIEGDDEE